MFKATTGPDLTIDAWRQLSTAEKIAAFKLLPPGEDDEFFLSLTAREQSELLLGLPEVERRLWVRLLPPDDAADLLQATPPPHRQALMQYLDLSSQREVTALLAYAEDEAGGFDRSAANRPFLSDTVNSMLTRLTFTLIRLSGIASGWRSPAVEGWPESLQTAQQNGIRMA